VYLILFFLLVLSRTLHFYLWMNTCYTSGTSNLFLFLLFSKGLDNKYFRYSGSHSAGTT
jgi:hypothetical protein